MYWSSDNGETQVTLYRADARDALRQISSESVQCVVTSPPYYGLRDYEVECQIGQEASPQEYVDRLVTIFREVRRVLRPDGTCWLNLGDTYGSGTDEQRRKDLLGMPWRVAFALQTDGWWLRCDVIWSKPNPLPESVTDRPTRSHEYIFLLAKSERYFYDPNAVLEPFADARRGNPGSPNWKYADGNVRGRKDTVFRTGVWNADGSHPGRNRRSVWTIPTQPFRDAHFAVFPEQIPRLCILAGTSPYACPACGAPWRRIVSMEGESSTVQAQRQGFGGKRGCAEQVRQSVDYAGSHGRNARTRQSLGWRPSCSCPRNDGSGKCIVLDPFAGAGTTLLVAQRLGRHAIGIELNPSYCEIARRRIEREHRQMRLAMGMIMEVGQEDGTSTSAGGPSDLTGG